MVVPFSHPDIKNYLSNYAKVYNDYAKIVQTDDDRIKLTDCAN